MNDTIVNVSVGLELTDNPHFQGNLTESLYNSTCYVATVATIYFNRVSERPSALTSRFSESLKCSKIFLLSKRTSIL